MMETTGVNNTQQTTGVNVSHPIHPAHQNPQATPSYEEYVSMYGHPATKPTPGLSPRPDGDYISPVQQVHHAHHAHQAHQVHQAHPVQPAPQAPVHSAPAPQQSHVAPTQQQSHVAPTQQAQEAIKALHQQEAVIAQQPVGPDLSDDATNVITLKLDGESLKLLMDANEIFRETIVNIGIKLAAETPVYKQYFKKESLRFVPEINGVKIIDSNLVSGSVGGANAMSTAAPTAAPTTNHAVNAPVGNMIVASEPVKKKSAGFGSWG